jgi:hypothetical protein
MRRWGRSAVLKFVRWVRTRWGWDERHDELAAHPLFRGLSRTVIRRLALDGDEVEFDAGQELLQKDHIGYWFFLVVEGTVNGDIGAGGYFGDVAVLGFRPQPTTYTATTHMRAWVFGRRHFLGLVYSEPLVQQRLFPGLDEAAFTAKVRELRNVGAIEWQALAKRPEWRAAVIGGSPLREIRPGRSVTRRSPSLFPPVPFVSRARSASPPIEIRLGWRGRAAMAGTVTASILGIALLYHPPLVVVTAGHPVDITDDITIDGATTYPVRGRYVLLPVRFSRPTAFAAVIAITRHRTHVPLAGDSREARVAATREARAAFKQSQVDALNAAALALHLDPRRVHATFRHRDISGPSAGLIYALALYDLLGPDDLARSRTVVATGSIDAAGGVGAIGFINDKRAGAAAAHADVFLVPAAQADAVAGSVGVSRLADALRLLAA